MKQSQEVSKELSIDGGSPGRYPLHLSEMDGQLPRLPLLTNQRLRNKNYRVASGRLLFGDLDPLQFSWRR